MIQPSYGLDSCGRGEEGRDGFYLIYLLKIKVFGRITPNIFEWNKPFLSDTEVKVCPHTLLVLLIL